MAHRFAKETNHVAHSNRPSGRGPNVIRRRSAALPTAGRILVSLIFLLSGLNELSASTMTIGYIEKPSVFHF